jgi:Dyp-type peroxidase family
MTAAWGNVGGIDVRCVCTDGIEFSLVMLSKVDGPRPRKGWQVEVNVKVTLPDSAAGPEELHEQTIPLDAEPNGPVVNVRDTVRAALGGDAPTGLFDPPYKWWDKWKNGQARVSYRSASVQIPWSPRPVGTRVVVDFATIVGVTGGNRRPGRMEGTSNYIVYVEDGVLPRPRNEFDEQLDGQLDLSLRTSETIQGNILAGFNKDHQVFLFFCFTDPEKAREWLRVLLSPDEYQKANISTPVGDGACWIANTRDVTNFNDQFRAARQRGSPDGSGLKAVWVNLALTFEGIRQLASDLEDGLIRSFKAFCDGPKAQAPKLGDVGDSAPERWVVGPDVHALLTIAADDVDDLQDAFWKQFRLAEDRGVQVLYQQRGDTLPGAARGREHFGFRDGVSQPSVSGYTRPGPGAELVDKKQFLLGKSPMKWMEDGSFQVFRRLGQDVAGWLAQVVHQSGSLPPEDQMTAPLLAAKLIGRWPSGTPLADAPVRDYRPNKSPEDDRFGFVDDPDGEKTPLFAHIRRQNPRDGSKNERRIIRRGIPYGPIFDLELDRGGSYGVIGDRDRGLCFNAFMADIDTQFEALQRDWANKPAPDGPDALVGEDGPRVLRRAGVKSGHELQLRRFVRTTGAVYAFAPSLEGLRMLAEGEL